MEPKQKILEAAREEFSEKGYVAASIGNITRRAGVNKAMVNYYFGSKEKLYHQVLMSMVDQKGLKKLEDYYEKMRGYQLDLAQILYCRIYVQAPLVTIINKQAGRFLLRDMLSERSAYREIFREILISSASKDLKTIRQGIEEGIFECSSPEQLLISEQLTALFIHFMPTIDEEQEDIKTLSKSDLFSIRENTLERVFKMLAVPGKEIFPVIPESIIKEMDNLVEELIDEGGYIDE